MGVGAVPNGICPRINMCRINFGGNADIAHAESSSAGQIG